MYFMVYPQYNKKPTNIKISRDYLKNISRTPDMISSFNTNTWANLEFPLQGQVDVAIRNQLQRHIN